MTDFSKSIFFCGDPHGSFDHIIQAVLEHRPAAIILLGDQQCDRPLDDELSAIIGKTEIAYIPGNHDSDDELQYDNLHSSSFPNLHARVTPIAGVKIAGIGGIFREKAWDPDLDPDFDPARTPAAFLSTLGKGNRWRNGLPLRHRTTIFASDLHTLSQQTANVLVTHEAPGAHPVGFNALTKLATAMGVTRAFHGHQHRDIVYGGGVWCGVGIMGITSLGGEIIVPGRFEDTYERSPDVYPR